MSKNVTISLKRKDQIQSFVEAGEEPRAKELAGKSRAGAKKEDMVRITLDLPQGVHRKLKIHVAGKGLTIADFLRDLLDTKLP